MSENVENFRFPKQKKPARRAGDKQGGCLIAFPQAILTTLYAIGRRLLTGRWPTAQEG